MCLFCFFAAAVAAAAMMIGGSVADGGGAATTMKERTSVASNQQNEIIKINTTQCAGPGRRGRFTHTHTVTVTHTVTKPVPYRDSYKNCGNCERENYIFFFQLLLCGAACSVYQQKQRHQQLHTHFMYDFHFHFHASATCAIFPRAICVIRACFFPFRRRFHFLFFGSFVRAGESEQKVINCR